MNKNLIKGVAVGSGVASGVGGAYALGRHHGNKSQEKKVHGLRSLYNAEIQQKRHQLSRQNQAVSNFLRTYSEMKRQ